MVVKLLRPSNHHGKSSSKNSKNNAATAGNGMQIRNVYSSENINIKSSSNNNRKRSRDTSAAAMAAAAAVVPIINTSPSKHQITSSRATPNPNGASGYKHSALAAAAYLASKFDAASSGGSAGGGSSGGGGGHSNHNNKNKVKEIHVGAKEKSTKKFVDIGRFDDEQHVTSKRYYLHTEVNSFISKITK